MKIMLSKNYKTYFATLICLLFIGVCNAQQANTDSLLNVLKRQKGNEKIKTYYALSQSFTEEPDSVLYYIQKGLKLAEETNANEDLAEGYRLLAAYWYNRGQTDRSIYAVKQALEIIPDKASQARAQAFSAYGLALMQAGKYKESAKMHLKSLADAEAMKDSTGIAKSFNNLGVIYWSLGDLDKALKYYEKAYKISKAINLPIYTAKSLSNIGTINHAKGNLKRAEDAFKEALVIDRNLNDQLEVATTLLNLGRLYEELEQFEKARNCYNESMRISHSIKDNIGVIYTSQNLAFLETKLKNYNRALLLLDSTLAKSKEYDFKEGIKYSYDAYSFVYSSMHNYKAAFENRLKYEAWKDSVANEDYLKATRELETKYETEKKQNEILLLSEENLKNKATILKKDNRIRTLAITAISIIFIAVTIFLVFRQRTRMEKQRAIFEAMAQTVVKEQQRVARDLHDSVGAMLASVKNRFSGLKAANNEQQQEYTQIKSLLARAGDETRRIAHNMMPEELSKFGLTDALEGLVTELNATSRVKIEFVHFNTKSKFSPLLELHIFRIVQELFQNILKHAKATKASLHLTKHRNTLNIMVEDNGVGMNSSKKSNQGIGLRNIQSRIDFVNGSMIIDSHPQNGTTVNINIPLS